MPFQFEPPSWSGLASPHSYSISSCFFCWPITDRRVRWRETWLLSSVWFLLLSPLSSVQMLMCLLSKWRLSGLTHTFWISVPKACQEPYGLWVAETVQILFSGRFWQDDDPHHRRGFHIPEWIFRLHWQACHNSAHRQVMGGFWYPSVPFSSAQHSSPLGGSGDFLPTALL